MIEYHRKDGFLSKSSYEPVKRQDINRYLAGLQESIKAIPEIEVARVVDLLFEAAQLGKTVFICGNGGSASTASHMACDLAKGTRVKGFPPVRAMALTDSMAQLTAWANDTSYENCFAGQLEGFGQPGDLLIAISGSGNSPNVLRAVETAQSLDMTTVGFAGFKGGQLKNLVDYCLVIPADNIEQVEDVHMILEHTICTALRHMMKAWANELIEAAS